VEAIGAVDVAVVAAVVLALVAVVVDVVIFGMEACFNLVSSATNLAGSECESDFCVREWEWEWECECGFCSFLSISSKKNFVNICAFHLQRRASSSFPNSRYSLGCLVLNWRLHSVHFSVDAGNGNGANLWMALRR